MGHKTSTDEEAWNYRVIRTAYTLDSVFGVDGLSDELREHCEIREVYFIKQPGCPGGQQCVCWSQITSISEDAVTPCGNSPEELRRDLEAMLKAFDRPVLDSNDPHIQELLGE